MINSLIKDNQTVNNIITDNISQEKKPKPKSRQQIYSENYQKNKEKKQAQRRARYTQKKEQEQQETSNYYGASSIKVLISLKEYAELNQQKKKLWLDFAWTLQDCEKGISGIEELMKLRETADNLIRDYRETTSKKIERGKNWNSLSEEEQKKLIRYWGWEKVRKNHNFSDTLEKLERESKEYEKEIELTKFHEERGKIKCECYDCETRKEIQTEIKKEITNQGNKAIEKEQCPECKRWVKELDEENGICKRCVRSYES